MTSRGSTLRALVTVLTDVYHITHVDNLASIIATGGLLCDARTGTAAVAPVSIGHSHIKQRRAARAVPVGPGQTLAEYVPTYFGPRSPMLFAIKEGAVLTYQGRARAHRASRRVC